MLFRDSVIYFGTFIILLTLMIGLICSIKHKSNHLIIVNLFVFSGLCISINSILFITHYIKRGWIVCRNTDLIMVWQFIFLFIFFYKSTKSKIKRYIFLAFSLAYLAFSCIHFYNSFSNYSCGEARIFKGGATLFSLIFSISFLWDIMNNVSKLFITKRFDFWIGIGVLIWSSISFPIYTLTTFVFRLEKYKNLSSQMISVSNLSLIVLYLFFLKAHLCLKYHRPSL